MRRVLFMKVLMVVTAAIFGAMAPQLGSAQVGPGYDIEMGSVPILINAARRSHNGLSTRFVWMLVAFDGLVLVVFAGLVGAAILLRWRGTLSGQLPL